jgi:hypothetical protein
LLWKKNKPIAYDFAATIFKKVPHVVKLPVIHHKILKQCKNMLILFPHSFTLHHHMSRKETCPSGVTHPIMKSALA